MHLAQHCPGRATPSGDATLNLCQRIGVAIAEDVLRPGIVADLIHHEGQADLEPVAAINASHDLQRMPTSRDMLYTTRSAAACVYSTSSTTYCVELIIACQRLEVKRTRNLTVHPGCLVVVSANSAVRLYLRSHVPRRSFGSHSQPEMHSTRATPIGLVPERVQPNASIAGSASEANAPGCRVGMRRAMLAPGSELLLHQPHLPRPSSNHLKSFTDSVTAACLQPHCRLLWNHGSARVCCSQPLETSAAHACALHIVRARHLLTWPVRQDSIKRHGSCAPELVIQEARAGLAAIVTREHGRGHVVSRLYQRRLCGADGVLHDISHGLHAISAKIRMQQNAV